jgi:hypothetical protein
MDLTELSQCTPKNIVRDSDAVSILRASMETTSKVYKTAKIYFGTTTEQDQLIQKAINRKIAPFQAEHILWKGTYGDDKGTVEYWYFMHGILIIRGIDGHWSLMAPRISKKQWQKLQES